jgi:dTDP-4-amino-4,6-dideoxygalactose transaminase
MRAMTNCEVIPIAKPFLDEREERAVLETLRGGWISQGPQCERFEKAVAENLGVKYACAVNSGTSAIHLTLVACGVRSGDEVIVPAFNCIAAVHPIVALGATPVPVDIELETYGIDSERVGGVITDRTKAIVVAHMFGLGANSDALAVIARQSGIPLIEDAALSLGSLIGDRAVGSYGAAACLSFHPRKMITTGEGGMIVTDSQDIVQTCREMRNYGASVPAWQRHHEGISKLPFYSRTGFNFKLTDIQAAIGLEQLKKLPEMISRRQKVALRYSEALSHLSWIVLPKELPGRNHIYQSYVCALRRNGTDSSPSRESVYSSLQRAGIAVVQGAQNIGAIDLYKRRFGWREHDWPNAAFADANTFALPIYPSLTAQHQDHVISTLIRYRHDS